MVDGPEMHKRNGIILVKNTTGMRDLIQGANCGSASITAAPLITLMHSILPWCWSWWGDYQGRGNQQWPGTSLVLSPSLCVFILCACGSITCAAYLSHRELLSTGPSGLILSTDDYFAHDDGYCYEPGLLGTAHEWNQSRGVFKMFIYVKWITKVISWLGKTVFQSDLHRAVSVVVVGNCKIK